MRNAACGLVAVRAGEDTFASDNDGSAEPAANESAGGAEDEPDHKIDDSNGRREREQQQSMRIPYKFRRDGVQDGRDRVPLFIQEDTKSEERDAQCELEDRFDDDVSLTDLREAGVKAGLQHLDEVEANLEEWGYGMTFDE